MTIWKHSRKDALLVGVALLESGVVAACYIAYQRGAFITLVLLAALRIFLACTNFQCVAHNFLHLPFFTLPWMNRVFAVWNTLLLGLPQTVYRHHHLNHHKFNSDYRDIDGKTQDLSSIYRYSRLPESAESFLKYVLLGPLRADIVPLLKTARAHNDLGKVATETLALVTLIAVFVWQAPWFAVQVYLPLWYLSHASAYGENYLEHFGAQPGNRKTDSVSCYQHWYNWIWFNNGYHQEHHWRPQIHWTRVPEVSPELPDAEHRRVVRFSHWFNWPILSERTRVRAR